MLQNTTVLLGAGGGPLTWVAVEVLRALQHAGARVRVVLSTETATFVPALTFQALTGGEVIPAEAMYGTMVGGQFRPLSAWLSGGHQPGSRWAAPGRCTPERAVAQ